EAESVDETRRAPHERHCALERRAGARAALREADHLALADRDLAGAEPGEAHDARPLRGAQTAVVNCRAADTDARQRIDPDLAQPEEGARHVVVPVRVAAGDEDIGPHLGAGREQDRSPTRLAPYDVEPDGCLGRRRLRAPQHDGGPVDRQQPNESRRRHRRRQAEQVAGRAGDALDRPVGSVVWPSPTAHQCQADSDESTPRYGSQSGREPPVATRIHPRSRGATGLRRSVSPESWRRRSSLRVLHRRHAATTLSHECGPPLLRGTTWSMFSAAAPQYWHRWPSRANTARRLSATRAWYGTFT